ncbi:GspH/FimT family pseudopilin [Variovorax sp. YR216]|uniref:GspH/FimT family pseudopilin n=1 Tax=Variovorax sp. YR216 TaxID=1882828 RepID=UPI0008966AC8|nr:GspH/FimT family pseudopilin [Variovorax sp. YR216]SEA13389.1 type IV fimbrial biogenesis protein FimT [Variovorax sp. YR216]
MSGTRPSLKQGRGFTLIEMMVVVALVAILGAVAVPGFRDLLVNQRLAATTSDFVASLSLARAEAIRHSQLVTLLPTNRDWSNGWEVAITDIDGNRVVLRAFDALRAGIAVDPQYGEGFNKFVSYDASGFSKTKSGAFGAGCLTFKADTGRRSSVVLSASGRPRVCDPGKKGDCAGACGT